MVGSVEEHMPPRFFRLACQCTEGERIAPVSLVILDRPHQYLQAYGML